MDSHKRFNFKIILCGDWAVGKTSLIQAFVRKDFVKEYKPTMGTDITIKDLYVDDVLINFMIWDIAGQEKWRNVRKRYYKGSSAIIVVFDSTRFPTFKNVEEKWMPEIREFTDSIEMETVPIILVSNKIDLTDIRRVTKEQGQELQQSIDAFHYMETSAKTGENVENLFEKLARSLVDLNRSKS